MGAPCTQCGTDVTTANRHHSVTYVHGEGVAMATCQPFCSQACRLAWWGEATAQPLVEGAPVGASNLVVTVCEQPDPSTPMVLLGPETFRLNPETVVEQHAMPTVEDVNVWWQTGVTPEEITAARDQFGALRAAASVGS